MTSYKNKSIEALEDVYRELTEKRDNCFKSLEIFSSKNRSKNLFFPVVLGGVGGGLVAASKVTDGLKSSELLTAGSLFLVIAALMAITVLLIPKLCRKDIESIDKQLGAIQQEFYSRGKALPSLNESYQYELASSTPG